MRPLRFGVSRSHAVPVLDQAAAGFAAVLGERAGVPMEVAVTRDYERLLEGLRVGAISVAWMPPLMHAEAAAHGAPLACVSERGGAITYRAALLVRSADGPHALAELGGARVAWSDPYSASGHLMPRRYLEAAGLDLRCDLGGERFYGSAAHAARAVLDREADLCACYVSDAAAGDPALAQLELRHVLGERATDLRVLAFTARIPADGLVLAPPLDGATQAALRDALLGLHQHARGRRALGLLLAAERLRPVTADVTRAIAALHAAPAR